MAAQQCADFQHFVLRHSKQITSRGPILKYCVINVIVSLKGDLDKGTISIL